MCANFTNTTLQFLATSFQIPSPNFKSWSTLTFGFSGALLNLFNLFIIIYPVLKFKANLESYEWIILSLVLGNFCNAINQFVNQLSLIVRRQSLLWCKTTSFLMFFLGPLCLSHPTLLFLNRYCILYKKHLYGTVFSAKNCILYCLAFWLFESAIVVQFWLRDRLVRIPTAFCVPVQGNFLEKLNMAMIMILEAFWYAISLFCGYKIVRKLKELRTTGQALNVSQQSMEKSKRLLILVALMQFMPLFLQTPTTVAEILRYFGTVNEVFLQLAYVPAFAMFVLDPLFTMVTIVKYAQRCRMVMKHGWAGVGTMETDNNK